MNLRDRQGNIQNWQSIFIRVASTGAFIALARIVSLSEQKIDYDTNPNPKEFFLEKLAHKASKMGPDTPEILLSFLGDVYQPAEMELMITRRALEIRSNHLPFTVLTKGGMRASRDFDLLEEGRARFGTTLIFMDQEKTDYWEPRCGQDSRPN